MWGIIGIIRHHITEIIAVTVAAAPIFSGSWAAFTWALQSRNDRRNKEFEIYHKLIKDLVEPADEKQPMRLDRQIAIIFELRRFTFYRPVTKRILAGLRKSWANQDGRLLEEMDFAIKDMGDTKD
jgi:hypothetical protein